MNLFIHLRIGVGGGGILPQLKKYQKLRQRDESQFIHEHLTLMDITYYSYLVECANRMKAYIYTYYPSVLWWNGRFMGDRCRVQTPEEHRKTFSVPDYS